MSLDKKYRPTSLDEIIGQDTVVESLSSILAAPEVPHAFLLVGSTGVGKTSTARIIAKMLGCTPSGLEEVNAATGGQIEDVRELVGNVGQRALGSPVRVYIIDECHNITKRAFESFLKTIEEPPAHVYFIFCTTDAKNLLSTVKGRCHVYNFKPVPTTVLKGYVQLIAELEGLIVSDRIFDLIAESANGSVRQALVGLSLASGVSDDAAAELLGGDGESVPVELKDIAALMVNNEKSWEKYQALLSKVPVESWTNLKPLLCNYAASKLISTKSGNSAKNLALVMDAIDQMPTYPASFEYKSSLLMAIWRIIIN